MTVEQLKEKIKKFIDEKNKITYISAILEFDRMTISPKGAAQDSANASTYLSELFFNLISSDEYKNMINEASLMMDQFDAETQRFITLSKREIDRLKNIDKEFFLHENEVIEAGYSKWIEAKEKADYSLFEPYLKDMVDVKRKEIELRAENRETSYDTLLNDYEVGGSQKQLDFFFNELKSRIVPLVRKIANSSVKLDLNKLMFNYPIDSQKRLTNIVLSKNGYDLNRGLVAETEHPFTTFPSRSDARITTHYYPTNFQSSLFSVIHEAGHAIFGQEEPEISVSKGIYESQSSAMHETISRFYENLVGRNKVYTDFIFDTLKNEGIKEIENVTKDEFYNLVNISTPSLIRCDSDELTYSLHILIRYEIEKDLINGVIGTKDLNKVWNAKYKEYLGIDVPNDKVGILQDVHWSQASFGYFPSYALGNAYGVQILNTMRKEMDFEKALEEEQLLTIKSYLRDKVFAYADLLDPNEWIKKITGEPLNPKYYLDYLEDKYTKIYKL